MVSRIWRETCEVSQESKPSSCEGRLDVVSKDDRCEFRGKEYWRTKVFFFEDEGRDPDPGWRKVENDDRNEPGPSDGTNVGGEEAAVSGYGFVS